jgi:hypothetical protein
MINFRWIQDLFRDADEQKVYPMVEQILCRRYVDGKVLERKFKELECGLPKSACEAMVYEVRILGQGSDSLRL